ncbi:hypothetical protein TM902_380024 [Tenacibaculum maritimum]|uniref:hypothetical protein n=1 Tax=Tenacibaculum maritimum TaxID=107401 RepID=UPI0012E67AC9|nr:hypothetical protein [Tenacibaculum maritimum]CAA0159697.1 hypothetical protein TM902_380024 [Tenacibaculum maritimum]CAA0230862.1 hypothetical protein JIP32914_400006 [Tenacibaculum maritimum]
MQTDKKKNVLHAVLDEVVCFDLLTENYERQELVKNIYNLLYTYPYNSGIIPANIDECYILLVKNYLVLIIFSNHCIISTFKDVVHNLESALSVLVDTSI